MAKNEESIEYDEDDADEEISDIGDELYVPDKPNPCSEDEAEYVLDCVSGRRKRKILSRLNHSNLTKREMDELLGECEND